MHEYKDRPIPNPRLLRLAQVGREAVNRALRPNEVRNRPMGPLGKPVPASLAPHQSLDEPTNREYIPINPINRIYMIRERISPQISEFMRYLAAHPEAEERLPALSGLSRELGISLGALREQLQVARVLGLVDVKPRTGTRRRPFSFAPAVRQSLTYALALKDGHFYQFANLRNHLEVAFWDEATRCLTTEDKQQLQTLVARAREKLTSTQAQVPHEEHRSLHLLIFRRLENPFVIGLLEAYWDMYEAVGLNLYSGDMDYLNEVWEYHAQMVEGICSGNFEAGRRALLAHIGLLARRPNGATPQSQLEGER
jgi:DNA-binding FadR family transcriptional regulator